MKKILLSITLLNIFIIAASAQTLRLSGRQWKLEELKGTSVTESTAYLEFDRGQKRFSGNAGCNKIFGSVDITGTKLTFSGVGATRMACIDAERQKVESTFLGELKKVDGFWQKDNVLAFLSDGQVVMRFVVPVKQRPQASSLEDMKWKLEAVGAAAVSKAGKAAFIVFDKEKSSAGGDSSCNAFGGNYSTNADTLKITDVVSTMRACIEDDRMDVERKFLDGLQSANRFEIEDGKLMLFRDDRLLLTFTGESK